MPLFKEGKGERILQDQENLSWRKERKKSPYERESLEQEEEVSSEIASLLSSEKGESSVCCCHPRDSCCQRKSNSDKSDDVLCLSRISGRLPPKTIVSGLFLISFCLSWRVLPPHSLAFIRETVKGDRFVFHLLNLCHPISQCMTSSLSIMDCNRLCLLILSLLVVCQQSESRDQLPPPNPPGKCSSRGQCGIYPGMTGGLPIPCATPGADPIVVQTDKLEEFRSICPFHARLIEEGKPLCCDAGQINSMIEGMNLPRGFLSSCPSCFRNFVAFFCAMSCDPDQASFNTVTKINKEKAGNSIAEVSLNVPTAYRDGLYQSCADVQGPAGPTTPAISIICGSEQCNPVKLLHFITSTPQAPFNVSFTWTDDLKGSMPVAALECSLAPTKEEWPSSQSPCSCADCKASCPLPYPWSDGKVEKNRDLKIVDAVLAVVVIVFTIALIAVNGIRNLRKRNRIDHRDVYSVPSATEVNDEGSSPKAEVTKNRRIEDSSGYESQRDNIPSVQGEFYCFAIDCSCCTHVLIITIRSFNKALTLLLIVGRFEVRENSIQMVRVCN